MPQTRNEAMAEAMREVAAELDEQRRLLEQILQVCVTTADGLGEHRQHTRDQVNRLGEKHHGLEHRVSALEKVAGRDD